MAIIDPAPGAAAAAATPLGGIGAAVFAAGEAVSAGISDQAIGQAKQAAEGLKAAAGSGQIRITPEGFDILMKALDDCDTRTLQMSFSVQMVGEPPKLGSSPYAATVATHVQKGGTGETQSADAVVNQLTAVFDEVRQALKKAKQAYEDNEHATVRKLK